MTDIKEYLPFLIPVVIAEMLLVGYTLYHILHHQKYKRGTRGLWIAVVIIGMQFIGPVLYFLLGKEDDK